MATTLKDRLKMAMKGPPEVKAADLARACGVSAPSVSAWISGDTKRLVGMNLLNAARCLNVNPEWLGTGKGAMRTTAPTVHVPTGTGDQHSSPEQVTQSRFVGLHEPTLHEALTLFYHDVDQAGEFPTLLARTERIAELYRRLEADGGRLSADGYKQFSEEIEARRGNRERVHSVGGKRSHGRN